MPKRQMACHLVMDGGGTSLLQVPPWALNRAGVDPANGSGPIATVIQVLLSILIYFSIVNRFL